MGRCCLRSDLVKGNLQLMSTTLKLSLFGVLLALVIVAGVVIQVSSRNRVNSTSVSGAYQVEAGAESCGSGWSAPRPGTQTFTIKNTTIAGEDVYLQNSANSAVYLQVEGLGAGASDTVAATLGKGSYRFVCLPDDANPVLGKVVRVPVGSVHAPLTPGIVPVTQNDMIPAAKAYGNWIQSQLPSLSSDAHALAADLDAGNIAQAKSDWLAGHTVYETLGAAYGSFGDFDTQIDGKPASGQSALSDPQLTGFHKIEALLYSGAPASQIVPAANTLVDSVSALQSSFPTIDIDPLDVGLRSHEILENALQFELTGATDAGSGTNLATLDANLTGTLEALAPIHGILVSRYPALQKTINSVEAAQAYVQSFQHPDGTWTPVESLDQHDRELLDSQISGTVELLAPIAAICDIKRPA